MLALLLLLLPLLLLLLLLLLLFLFLHPSHSVLLAELLLLIPIPVSFPRSVLLLRFQPCNIFQDKSIHLMVNVFEHSSRPFAHLPR